MTTPTNTNTRPSPETPRRPRQRRTTTSGICGASGQVGLDTATAAAAALHDDGDEVGLLHGPDTLDQLWNRDPPRLLDAQSDQALGDHVGEFGSIVQVQLLERFEDVIEAPQPLSPLLICFPQHR